MGNRSTKSSLRNAIIYLNISADTVSEEDEKFWNQIFLEEPGVADEVIKCISTQEIRMLRDGSPKNFALLAYKMVAKLYQSTGTLCNTHSQQIAVLNAIRVLIRILPCVFEDNEWQDFFEVNFIDTTINGLPYNKSKLTYPDKSNTEKNYRLYLPTVPGGRAVTIDSQDSGPMETSDKDSCCKKQLVDNSEKNSPDLLISEDFLADTLNEKVKLEDRDDCQAENTTNRSAYETTNDSKSLMNILLTSICDLLFCPEFTVLPHRDSYLSDAVDAPPEDLKSLSTYDYVWEPGVGFDSNVNSTNYYDKNRSELLRALLVSLSATLYEKPERSIMHINSWLEIFVSKDNRHALPLFTSLLNVIFNYKPSRPIIQFTNSTVNEGNRETLVGLATHILLAALDYKIENNSSDHNHVGGQNLFIDYMSRIHREEDYTFMVQGFTRLLNSGLVQGFLWASSQQTELDLELMLLFWKICNQNRKFMLHLLKSNETLDIVVPILYHLNKNFQDPSKTALIHLGVFNLLILSGERNFGVKLNKPYATNILANLPEFSGSHADLMVIVFHKLIMYGYKINQLYDYLLNILTNISPYLKGLTILASKCLMQLFETFSSPFVIFTEPNYHQLVIFILEIFNNLIQYQFDGNANLIYIILTKKEIFIKLANLPTAQGAIDRVLRKLIRRKMRARQMEMTCNLNQQDSLTNTCDNDKCPASISDEDFFNFDLATVSCEICQYSSNPSRQEVSLVATPDIHHFTQTTRLFMSETETTIRDDSDQLNSTDQDSQLPSIIFDDILNQYPGHLLDKSASKLTRNADDDSNSGSSSISECKNVSSSADTKNIKNDSENTNQVKIDSGGKISNSIGKKWRPTSDWLIEWKRSLPLQTVLRMINALVPQVEQFKQSTTRVSENEIIKFLQNGTLVGLLPVPHPILIRKYRTNNDSSIWFRACTWAIIYVKSTAWMNTDIRLIRIL